MKIISWIFIAEIALDFNRSLNKAKDLIYAAKEAGAHVAKFQHYSAETLVSDMGFRKFNNKKYLAEKPKLRRVNTFLFQQPNLQSR